MNAAEGKDDSIKVLHWALIEGHHSIDGRGGLSGRSQWDADAVGL